MLTRIAACTLIAMSAHSALAAGEDLDNCRWQNGQAIQPQVCQHLQQAAAREQAAHDEARRNREAALQRQEAQAAAQLVARARAQEWAASQAADAADQASSQKAAEDERARVNLAKFEAQDLERKAAAAKFERELAQDEARQAAFIAAKKRACGADYAKPAIGMPIERVRNCVGDLTLVSQVNRTDGVASVYSAGRLQLVVIGGKVAAWHRY